MSAGLLEHFERLAEAPGAIPRLRRLVLDLAVRGKLVAQDASEKPVLIPIDSNKINQSISRQDDFPKSWEWRPLESLINLMDSGWSPQCETEARNSDEQWAVLKTTAVQPLSFDATQNKLLPEKFAPRTECEIQKGDLLVTRAGPKNRVGVSCVVNAPSPRLMLSDKIIRIRVISALFPDYIALTFNAGRTMEQIEDAKSGMAVMQMNISQQKLKQILIPVPPLAEQHRIVAKVDELMGLLDRIEAAQATREATRQQLATASLARLSSATDDADFQTSADFLLQTLPTHTTRRDQIKQLRQTILNLAVRGRLVPQDVSEKPVSIPINSKKSKSQDQAGKPAAEIHHEAPANWVRSTLGEVGDWGSGSTPSRARDDYFGGSHTWLKSGELNDTIGLRGSEEKITNKALEQCSFRKNRAGDVLIAMYGATIGKLAILAEDAVTNQAVCGCTPKEFLSNHYLFIFLLSQREQFQALSEGGAQPNISKVKIVSTPILVPPLAEQHRIVAKVDELMALCDRLDTALAQAETARTRLLDAELHAALNDRGTGYFTPRMQSLN